MRTQNNYFTMPNEVFQLGLSAGELAVYSYLRRCEDRRTHQCWPSYRTIGSAVGMSENTVRKYVLALEERGLIVTEPTDVRLKSGRRRNGNLKYTLPSIQEVLRDYYARQRSTLEAQTERQRVQKMLADDGFEDNYTIVTEKHTFTAPFVNAEETQYLCIEDHYTNGRPPLELGGVLYCDRETVDKIEKMKVCTCLNPLHTAMSIYGCMLDYTLISAEMADEDLRSFIQKIGYIEAMPVVVDPGVLNPYEFIGAVINRRLPNPFMPDAPQRIATDTSQKLAIRFGETIKSYVAEGRDLNTLVSIPLAIAGWLRYLLAIDDNGNAFEVSADPLKDDLQAKLATIKFGAPDSCTDQLDSILSNASIFGSDLTKTVLADKVKAYFKAEIAGPGAVRKTLHDAVNA